MIKKVFFLLALFFLFNKSIFGQCTYSAVSSTYGWTATVTYSVTSVVVTAPSPTTSCAFNSYYQFAPVVSYSVSFTGGTSNRSVTLKNLCVNCLNRDGATKCTDCANTVGTFNANTTGSLIVNNNSCEYDATYLGGVPTYPAPKISCTSLNLNNAGCTSASMDIQYTNVNPNDTYISAYSCVGIAPMPIELLSFTAKLKNNKIDLNWATATETNNHYFTIEKSKDALSFEEVSQVNGAENSTQILNYSVIDTNPYGGVSYYRLKQTDNNGDFKYFQIVPVENKIAEIIISNIHPNPTTTGNFSFDIYSPNKSTLRIQLIDNVGRSIFDNTQSMNGNQTKINIETTSITSGVYILKTSILETGVILVNKIIKN